ncbi:MAG TPA: BMP family ABC transporter substrate-binding protein [Candidatus Limnocylindrales bacterium]|nr:BMP family ABC transporter substrate-binding protein [Candidatus Limnocylindrales bacterium]
MRNYPSSPMAVLAILVLILAACSDNGGSSSAPASEAASESAAESQAASESAAASEAPVGLAACGDEDSGDALLIGGVTDVGQLEDKSFNEGGWCGTIAGATAVGGTADVIVTEDPADYQNNMQTFIDQGYEVIVTYGFALGNDTTIAAKENPEIQFIGLDQSICVDENGDPDPTFACAGDAAELLPNYQGLVFAEAQAGYLAGVVAATISETGVIGAVGGIESVPPVKAYIGGYQNGALSVNPDIEVLVTYVSEDITTAFNDPTTGASLAEQMIGQDADVIFQVAGLSGQGALEASCDADIYGIGVDVDQALALPNLTCIVTSAEKKLVEAVSEAIQRVADGSAVGGTLLLDASSDPPKVAASAFHNHADLLTDDLQTLLDDATAAMAAGELDPCEGDGECPFE